MENFKREIFEHLGQLFYAIAKGQQVMPIEFGELKMLLRKDWLTDPQHQKWLAEPPVVANEPMDDAAHIIILAIDALQAESATAERAFTEFTDFYTRHSEQFTEALKEKIVSTARAIIGIFPLGNYFKNNYLIRIGLLFQKPNLVMDHYLENNQ